MNKKRILIKIGVVVFVLVWLTLCALFVPKDSQTRSTVGSGRVQYTQGK